MLNNTYGLVVCGGQSTRMGTDKSMLTYYDKPQRYHLYDLLSPLCEKVFISCNENQSGNITGGYDYISDLPRYKKAGPIASLLSAFEKYPTKNILLVGCDYPFLSENELGDFLNYCDAKNNAVSFCNKDDFYEPLLAWYPHHLSESLKVMVKVKQYSLQQFLRNCNAIKYRPNNQESLISIDTHEQYIKVLKEIKHEQPG